MNKKQNIDIFLVRKANHRIYTFFSCELLKLNRIIEKKFKSEMFLLGWKDTYTVGQKKYNVLKLIGYKQHSSSAAVLTWMLNSLELFIQWNHKKNTVIITKVNNVF